MASVTPKQIYQALLNAGASSTQAIGMMANGLAESGLNPEAVGDNGTSFGIWQQHGAGYAGLVTGNPPVDMKAQVSIVASNGGFAAANGSTPAAAAGNFSANYERCTQCQPGQSSYSQRVANAATVAGWVSSGNWPTSAGSGGSGSGGGGSQAGSNSACLVGIHGPSIPILGSVNLCFVSKSQARAIIGGGLLVGSAFAGLVGLLILAAAGFRMSGAGKAAGGALEGAGAVVAFVPGAEGAGLALGAAGATARRASAPGAGRRSLDRRQARRREAASEQAAGERTQAREDQRRANPRRLRALPAEKPARAAGPQEPPFKRQQRLAT